MDSVARPGKENLVLAGKGTIFFSSGKSGSYDTEYNRFIRNFFLWQVTLLWIPAFS